MGSISNPGIALHCRGTLAWSDQLFPSGVARLHLVVWNVHALSLPSAGDHGEPALGRVLLTAHRERGAVVVV